MLDDIERLGVSIDHAAKALDCSNRHIYNLHYRGVLRFFKVGTSNRIPPEDLRAYRESTMSKPKVMV